jgi:hypothetical protein
MRVTAAMAASVVVFFIWVFGVVGLVLREIGEGLAIDHVEEREMELIIGIREFQ